jgi:flagellar L-ring protein precursor FlgH
MKKTALVSLLVVILAGCASVPAPITHQPMSIRPAVAVNPPSSSGAIFSATASRGLFEDRTARMVGDNLTIQISESLSASSSAATKAERTSSASLSAPKVNMPFFPGYLENKLESTDVSLSGSNKTDGKGETSSKNTFNASITVTVIEVLNNGNLLVSGEKQMMINDETQYLRVSGIVNPADIKAGNVVASTKVADARVQQVGTGQTASAQVAGWLAKFFMSFSPF